MHLYRLLPSVNDVLLMEDTGPALRSHPRRAVVRAVQQLLDGLREEIASGIHSAETLAASVQQLPERVARRLREPANYSLRKVINATGVILHTNLGRAPLSRAALEHMTEVAQGYSNLEFDIGSGERGSRDVHVESLLLSVLSDAAKTDDLAAYRAIVVNNCAAATFLVLHALAKGKEVLVSRGELIEIGGGFRIPEILEESGAMLKEVGTTNRTRLADYEDAISASTGMILRVHQSNFTMDGFVEKPRLEELVALGRRMQLPVFADQGTGLLRSIPGCGLEAEPSLADCITQGCDLIAASGDKLLGGPQCGIIVGKRELVDRLRRNPLFRAFRVDKLTYAALEATLMAYSADAVEMPPVQRMLTEPPETIRTRCDAVTSAIGNTEFQAQVIRVESVIGGGTAPKARLRSFAVALWHSTMEPPELLNKLRQCGPPVIGRIEDDRVLLDLRTVDPDLDSALIDALKALPHLCEPAHTPRSS